MFDCHINHELCMSPLAPKYLFKYVTKGEDRAMVRTEVDENEDIVKNEIDEYVDLRSVGSSEAAWHVFNFNIAKNYPAVYVLRIHLEDEQHVVFDMETTEQVMESQRTTELTEFFSYNLENPDTQVTYMQTFQSISHGKTKSGFQERGHQTQLVEFMWLIQLQEIFTT